MLQDAATLAAPTIFFYFDLAFCFRFLIMSFVITFFSASAVMILAVVLSF